MLKERPSMGIAFVSTERKISEFVAAALLLSSLSLGECETATAGSSLMDAKAQATPPKTSIYDARKTRHDSRRTVEDAERTQRRARPPGGSR
jgi:hypothetical protein